MRRTFYIFICCVVLIPCGCNQALTGKTKALSAIFPTVPVVFMGDSITFYWGPGQQGNSDAFTVNHTWTDAGIYGETSGQMLNRFQTDVIAASPRVVHILAGTNDVYPGWVLCGGAQDVDTCDNIKAMVAMSRAAGIEVIIGSIPPWGPGGAASGFDPSPDRYTRINQLNQWIEQYCEQNKLTFVNYHALLVSSDGNTYEPDLTIDGIHPSPQAYSLMTPTAEQAIADSQRK
jgi:lysophospholipase L1-like esterase